MNKIIFFLTWFLGICFSHNENLSEYNNPSHCQDAIKICDYGDYHYSSMFKSSVAEDLNIDKSSIKSTNSLWLQFKAETSGQMEFVIIPNNDKDDFDFILYNKNNSDCTQKKPLRVMTSGQVIGSNLGEDCLGQTGLREFSNDIIETDGCNNVDDNFLKPVFLEEGLEYLLFVNNYNSEAGFNILFSGTNQLSPYSECDVNNVARELTIFPNPASEFVNIKLSTTDIFSESIDIIDQLGRIVEHIDVIKDKDLYKLSITNYSPGSYLVRWIGKDRTELESFVKL